MREQWENHLAHSKSVYVKEIVYFRWNWARHHVCGILIHIWLCCAAGMTGSYCYMSPENYLRMEYGETSDTFSFGTVMYEVFSRHLVCLEEADCANPMSTKDYARRVSVGYRPAISAHMHSAIRDVIEKCWRADPVHRPRMKEIVANLKEINASGNLGTRICGQQVSLAKWISRKLRCVMPSCFSPVGTA